MPRPHVSVFVWKRRHFPLVWPSAHTYPVKTITKNASFQKCSPEWKHLKTLASCLHVDGRKRRFSNSMMSYIVYTSYITSITHGRCAGWYLFPSFELFCLDGGKRFDNTKCRRVFWGKRREKIKKKYSDKCGRDLNPSTVSHCVQPPTRIAVEERRWQTLYDKCDNSCLTKFTTKLHLSFFFLPSLCVSSLTSGRERQYAGKYQLTYGKI